MGRTSRRATRFGITVLGTFSGAHRLRLPNGEWEPLHGHNWKAEVVIAAQRLDRWDMAVDFLDVQKWLRDTLAKLEHRYLNEMPEFRRRNPSAERIAIFIAEQVARSLKRSGCRVVQASVWETDETCATYYPSA